MIKTMNITCVVHGSAADLTNEGGYKALGWEHRSDADHNALEAVREI
jgi:hypothetical protein